MARLSFVLLAACAPTPIGLDAGMRADAGASLDAGAAPDGGSGQDAGAADAGAVLVPLLPPVDRAAVEADFFSQHPVETLKPMTVEAIQAFLQAEAQLESNQPAAAKATLAALWAKYPVGSNIWGSVFDNRPVNVGSPAAYYGLRMLTDLADFRAAGGTVTGAPVRLTVVMPGCSRGIQPATLAEVDAGMGTVVESRLRPEARRDGYRVLAETLQVFRGYLEAATQGALRVEVEVLELPDLCLRVSASRDARGVLRAMPDSFDPLWAAVPNAVRARTDWWMLIYPSHVPPPPELRRLEWITGGMGVGADGCSPLFIADDSWAVRIPGHLGDGDYSELERRIYLPQWLQHEFFHHLYRTWSPFELEKSSHQWFNRATWPADFVGIYEPDYYAESLHKRLQGATPNLGLGLRCAAPSPADFAGLTEDSLLGTYERLPVENGYHRGTITRDGSGLRWTNEAGRTWRLTFERSTGTLVTGADNPYPGRDFFLQLKREADGRFGDLLGFSFSGELYSRRP